MAKKNLAVFLDGTWNEPGDNTNVWRLKVMLASHGPNGVPQLAYYDTGVGTKWYERVRGAVGGSGLSRNVRDAYQWLVEHYDDDDEVFIFGFSRGAYTARSLAGVIVKCGLLRPGAAMTVLQIYERYKLGKDAVPLYEIEFQHKYKKRELDPVEHRLLDNSRRIPIAMIGVWDTVGSLGIPWTQAPLMGRANFYFHNTNLSTLFGHAYHALAIDEHRSPYRPTVWTRFAPADKPFDPLPKGQTVEQRWFIGAHCNVGGGYANDDLAQIPLAWLQDRAIACGLGFRHRVALRGDEWRCDPRDSYAEFLKGAWRILRAGKRFHRVIGAAPRAVRGGKSASVNEVIDASVFRRYRGVPTYRPKNLEAWAKGRNIDLQSVSGDQLARKGEEL